MTLHISLVLGHLIYLRMQIKEYFRKSLSPYLFYKLVDVKNTFFPTPAYKALGIQNKKAVTFYGQMIKHNDLVFDIGANFGHRVGTFLKLGARVIAVEPQEKCIRFMKSMYGNRVSLLQKGAGAAIGEMDFYSSDNAALSTFSKSWIESVQSSNRFESFSWTAAGKVPITTLDELVNQFGKPAFIKIDVEGLEYEVLLGLSQSVNYLSFEYAVPENISGLKSCLERMSKLGSYQLNYSIGETMQFALNSWMSMESFLSYIESPTFINSYAGDIYLELVNTSAI